MNEKLEKFKEYIKGKEVAMIGAGISNMASLDLLLRFGASVTMYDRSPEPTYTPDGEGGRVAAVIPILKEKGVGYHFGENYLEKLRADIILKTPAVRYDVPELAAAVKDGAVLSSEVGLFCELCPCRIFAVTGSDGKTTTTTLIYKMLSEEFHGTETEIHLGGNIGTPLLPEIESIKEHDFVVLELSSFQLQTMRFSPFCAVVTNISPNHLNWHTDMTEYVESKANIFAYQMSGCRAVFNAENKYTREFASRAKSDVTLFSSKGKPDGRSIFLREDKLVFSDGDGEREIMSRQDIRLVGVHNAENYMAATAAVRGIVSDARVKKVAREFCGVRHRLEEVACSRGIKYYNSSIDTTPSRTIAALNSFEDRVILIIGGSDKNIPPEPMLPVILEKTKFVCATGATGEKLFGLLLDFGYPRENIIYERDFDAAVKLACGRAQSGDTVLLSPAAASFDSFRNFEVRGDRFCDIVRKLIDNK